MTRWEIAALWSATYFGALVAFAARIAYLLFQASELPPEELAQLRLWKLKRRWMTISEFSALPAFATAWTLVSIQGWLSPPVVVLGSMASGALGFGFLLHALQVIVMRKVKNA